MTQLDKILGLANSFKVVGKIENIRNCLTISAEQIIGNKTISVCCSQMGIMKSDYIDFLEKEYKRRYGYANWI